MNFPLIAFKQERHAYLLSNHLSQEGISAAVVAKDNDYLVVVNKEEQIEAATHLCRAYLKDPTNRRYQEQAWLSDDMPVSSKPVSWDLSPVRIWATSAPLTALVIVIAVMVYLGMYVGFWPVIGRNLMMQPLPILLESMEFWRLLGPSVIHFSLMHIVFNLLWWGVFGGQIERKMGVSTLLLVFVFASVITSIGQTFISGTNFGGLSGVVYAVVGFVWWMQWLAPDRGLMIPPYIVGFMLVWLLIGYADVLWFSTANTALTLGLITGCLLALLYVKRPNKA